MLAARPTYDALYRDFRWQIPERFNIGVAVSNAWAAREPGRICLQHFLPDAPPLSMTYGELAARSDAFAAALAAEGVRAGDRVAILLPQGFETVVTHVAIYKLGAIALPLAPLFGADALLYRLRNAGARAIVTNRFGLDRLAPIRSDLPTLELVVTTEPGEDPAARSFQDLVSRHAGSFAPWTAGRTIRP